MSPISLGAKVIDPYTPGCLVRQRYPLVYARVHDNTLQHQFATAMAQIEAVTVTDWPAQTVDPRPAISMVMAEICHSV
jgi:hypothetical protein